MNGRLKLLTIGAPLALAAVWPLTALNTTSDVVVVAQGEQVCPGTHLSAGNATTFTITAPDGQLISAVCVKAGSAVQGDGPEFYTYDPPVSSVTISHSSGKAISHYSVTYVPVPIPTTQPATTTTIDRCPEEPCTPGTQTTLPGTTTTVASTVPSPTTVPATTTTSAATTSSSSPAPTTTTSVAGTATSAAPTATTSPAVVPFAFGAAASVCVAEVPTIRIVFQNTFPELAGRTGTLTMSDVNGNVVSTQELVYEPGTTVDLLYPGTRVNPDGSIADVPGWNLNAAGFWVRDPSDAFLREGINLTYTVNPTATAFVTYPPETSACANPNGPFPPGQTITAMLAGDLPATGPNEWMPTILGLGVGALGVGFGLRRRYG